MVIATSCCISVPISNPLWNANAMSVHYPDLNTFLCALMLVHNSNLSKQLVKAKF